MQGLTFVSPGASRVKADVKTSLLHDPIVPGLLVSDSAGWQSMCGTQLPGHACHHQHSQSVSVLLCLHACPLHSPGGPAFSFLRRPGATAADKVGAGSPGPGAYGPDWDNPASPSGVQLALEALTARCRSYGRQSPWQLS